MRVFVLGGGPTGLAIADALADSGGPSFVLYERGHLLGGLAQTVEWPGIGHHDLGPHKIFSLNPQLVERVERLLPPGAWLTRTKSSSIFLRGQYLPYPPSPLSLGRVYGSGALLNMAVGYILAQVSGLFRNSNGETFEQDLVHRVGGPLYEALFSPIAKKLWGNPATLDAKLSRGRVQTPSLLEALQQVLGRRRSSSFEALTFRYPHGGLREIWRAIREKAGAFGQFCSGHEATRIEIDGGRVVSLSIRAVDTGTEQTLDVADDDFVVSTLPLRRIAGLIPELRGSALAREVEKVIRLNDLVLVFLHFETQSLLAESWIFVPDSSVVFHRVSEQESFDPAMTPNGTIVCCELMSSPERPLTSRADEDLIQETLNGLAVMGHRQKLLAAKVIRLPQSYPVFHAGFEPALDAILTVLDAVENFRSVGRQGAFNYIGTLDAMDIGYGFVNWLQNPSTSWSQERQRTSHYPVLD